MLPFRPGIQKSALFPVCSHAMTQSRILWAWRRVMKTTITFGSDYCPLVISIEAKDGRLLQSCSPLIARDGPRGPAQNGAEIKTKTNREP